MILKDIIKKTKPDSKDYICMDPLIQHPVKGKFIRIEIRLGLEGAGGVDDWHRRLFLY